MSSTIDQTLNRVIRQAESLRIALAEIGFENGLDRNDQAHKELRKVVETALNHLEQADSILQG